MNSPQRPRILSLIVSLMALVAIASANVPRLLNHSFVAESANTLEPSSLPESRASDLPTFTTSSAFPIAFKATAGSSQIAYVELFYNRNGSGWTKHGDRFPSSPIDFDSASTGGDGSYGFYTIAVDDEGNSELPPNGLVPDADTIVDTQPPSFGPDTSSTQAWTGDPFSFRVAVADVAGIGSVAAEYWQTPGATQSKMLLPDGEAYSGTIVLPTNITQTLHYRFSAIDGAGLPNSTETRDVAVVDNDPPRVQVTRPAGGEILRGSGNATISWASDDNVGLASSSATISQSLNGGSSWTQLGDGLPTSGSVSWAVPAVNAPSALIAVAARDSTGNVGRTVVQPPLIIDSTPPTTTIWSPPVVAGNSFTVGWTATDSLAGVDTYHVQFRVGNNGTWQDWLTSAPHTTTSAVFGPTSPAPVNDGSVFYIRARATDKAGNEEQFSDSRETHTAISRFRAFIPLVTDSWCADPTNEVKDGTFDQGYGDWEHGGGLPSAVVDGAGRDGGKAMVLGNPNYLCDGKIPVDQSAWIKQKTTISSCARGATLAFAFRMITFDVMWSDAFQQYVDTLELTVRDANTGEVLHFWQYGNGDSNSYGCNRRMDLGWQEHRVDLSAFRGRTVQLEFANWNRIDGYLNTFTYIDDVRFE